VPGRVAAETLLDGERAQAGAEQRRGLGADDVVAGDQRDRATPRPAQRGIDADLADERPVEAQVVPVGRADRVREHAAGGAGAGVLADEQRCVTALLEQGRVLGPACLHDELAAGIEGVRDQRIERAVPARAVAVHHDHLARTRRERATDGRVDLLGVEAAALLVAGLVRADLVPARDARDALHVADDEDLHRRTRTFDAPAGVGVRAGASAAGTPARPAPTAGRTIHPRASIGHR
jgi:hypothetical protein